MLAEAAHESNENRGSLHHLVLNRAISQGIVDSDTAVVGLVLDFAFQILCFIFLAFKGSLNSKLRPNYRP